MVNSLGRADTSLKDIDGITTIKYLEAVRRRISRVTTGDPGSVGLHPLVYFYTRGGAFQPVAFLAAIQVIGRLAAKGQLDRFCDVRRAFEAFLMRHKEAFTLIVKALGAGPRSRPALENFLDIALQALLDGKSESEVVESMAQDSRFRFLATPQPSRGEGRRSRGFDSSAKSAAFITSLEQAGVRCALCGGLLHRNSMSADHIVRSADGGGSHSGNAQLTHPYCNTGYKEGRISRHRRDQAEPSTEV